MFDQPWFTKFQNNLSINGRRKLIRLEESSKKQELPMKEVVNIVLEIAEEIDSMSESGDLERCLRMLALLVELLLELQIGS
jgi:hypothetical protein